MSKVAQRAARANAGYRILRELGSRKQSTYAALREARAGSDRQLLVVQRFARGARVEGATALDTEAMALLLRDARCLAKNGHPNIGHVRHAEIAGRELTIASELHDGATLEDLFQAGQPAHAFPVLARILLDVLAGLHALHGLRDGMNTALGAIHGELCPANVIVGRDGVARIVNVLRKRPVTIASGSEAVGYAAPEALDAGGTDDPRADVYAVGVMLWEGITGRRLYEETDPARVLSRQREGELPTARIHPSSPFARLSDVAMRALAFEPALRFASAADMATDLREIAGTRLATGVAVAAIVEKLAGDVIRIRRASLDPTMSGTRKRASERAIAAAKAMAAASAATTVVTPTDWAPVPTSLLSASRPSTSADPVEGLVLLDEEGPDDEGPGEKAPDENGLDDDVLMGDELVDDPDERTEAFSGPRSSTPAVDVDFELRLAMAQQLARATSSVGRSPLDTIPVHVEEMPELEETMVAPRRASMRVRRTGTWRSPLWLVLALLLALSAVLALAAAFFVARGT